MINTILVRINNDKELYGTFLEPYTVRQDTQQVFFQWLDHYKGGGGGVKPPPGPLIKGKKERKNMNYYGRAIKVGQTTKKTLLFLCVLHKRSSKPFKVTVAGKTFFNQQIGHVLLSSKTYFTKLSVMRGGGEACSIHFFFIHIADFP